MALIGNPIPGETPLREEDLKDLKLPWIKTREQLNEVEGENIVSAKEWALKSRNAALPGMLSDEYIQSLHKRMYRDVWKWAGKIRHHELQNEFASKPSQIRIDLKNAYNDAKYWLEHLKLGPEEFAVQVHHRIVRVHPFHNGNGRHARLMADLILERHFKLAPLQWGGGSALDNDEPNRANYISALKAADAGDYGALLRLSCQQDAARK